MGRCSRTRKRKETLLLRRSEGTLHIWTRVERYPSRVPSAPEREAPGADGLLEGDRVSIARPVRITRASRMAVLSNQKENGMLKNKSKVWALFAFACLLAFVAPAQAAFDTNVTNVISDATTAFSAVQTLVVTILAFSFAVWIVNKLRRR